MNKCQQGYFLILAVIFIFVIGLLGIIIANLFAKRAFFSVTQQNGLNVFYIAESAIEIGTRLLTVAQLSGTPTRVACGSMTGHTPTTNASLGSGVFTITTINSSPIFATTTLSGGITSSSTTIDLTSTIGFESTGRVMIDRELVDYGGISANTLVGVTHGVGGSTAASHASGAAVGQYQCSLDAQSYIPDSTSASYQRELKWSVQLQDGWIVGNNAGSNFTFLRWNRPTELSWSAASVVGGSSTVDLNAISMISYADGWAVGNVDSGNFILLHWNGSNWQLSTISGACGTQDLLGVSMLSSQEGWIVGGRYRPGCGGGSFRYTVMKWNGSSWSLLTPTSTPHVPDDNASNQHLNAVHVIDTNADGLGNIGFAVGNNGTILQYNGSHWVSNTSPTSRDLFGIYTVSNSEAWAVGNNGEIIKWNGSSWSTVSSPVSNRLNSIVMLDTDGNGAANFGWAVGNTGKIMTYNGSSWSLSADIGSTNLLAVAIVNTNEAWAVGASGAAYYWNGSNWSSVSSGTSRTLHGISMIAPVGRPMSSWQQVFH